MEITRLIKKQVPFSLSEFCIDGVASCPNDVREKIWKYHISPVLNVRKKMGVGITASEKSCYRPFKWEIKKGRSGNSQHTFGVGKDEEVREHHLGACDWTIAKRDKFFKDHLRHLHKLLIEDTLYTRICLYPTFIHCDYKARDGKKYLFVEEEGKWVLDKKISIHEIS